MTWRRGRIEKNMPSSKAKNDKDDVGNGIGNVSAIVGSESVRRYMSPQDIALMMLIIITSGSVVRSLRGRINATAQKVLMSGMWSGVWQSRLSSPVYLRKSAIRSHRSLLGRLSRMKKRKTRFSAVVAAAM